MSLWSRNAAQRFIERNSTKQIGDAGIVPDWRMIDAQSPLIWGALSKSFERRCSEFSSERGTEGVLSFDGTDPVELRITRTDSQASLRIRYLKSLSAGNVEGLKDDMSFSFRVMSGTSQVALFPRNVDGHLEPDEIATAMLEIFLEIRDQATRTKRFARWYQRSQIWLADSGGKRR